MRGPLHRNPFAFFVIVVFFGGLAYVGWHTSADHNGTRTVGSSVLLGLGFAIVFSLIDLLKASFKAWRDRNSRLS